MADFFERLDRRLIRFIEAQKIFFTATAPAEGPAADQIAELFVQSGVVAVNQWRYAPEDTPFPQNTARFTFHMNGDSKKTLPEYPIPVPCESRPVS